MGLTESKISDTVRTGSDRCGMKKKRSKRATTMNRKRERLLSKLPDFRQVLRGTLVTRFRRCGRPNCHCAQKGDPGHGPAYYLMVTIAKGETIQIYVPKEHKKEVEQWIKNFNLARRTLEEISSVNRTLLKEGMLFTRR